MKTSYVFLATGYEEMEAICPVDMLRRAGMPVKTVSISDELTVTGAHSVEVKADMLLKDLDDEPDAEWLILPGGMPGASNLYDSDKLRAILLGSRCRIGAICAAPAVVLGQLGMLKGHQATCYPGFEPKCQGAVVVDDTVVVDDRFVTAKGPAWAMDFAITMIAQSKGDSAAAEVADGMLM